ncbi:ABC transporter substrate-binding protein [Scrofimicrobium canadense]|nr:sugar ABC transporter substrate-binding protein [Scrofimicrobium canadense]
MKRSNYMKLMLVAGATATALAGCGGSNTPASGSDSTSEGSSTSSSELTSGPIEIWYSTNEQEIEWGEKVVEAWNAEHPDEQVTAQTIPAGSSSEDVISASIAAGNTPCLVYNTAPSAVPDFQKAGGLVNLSTTFEDGNEFIQARSGSAAEGFKSADGDYYQLPWKTNPFMLYYNKDAFTKAGLDAENPKLETYADFLAAAKAIKDSGAADYAIYPPSTSDYTNVNFDFYPFFLANSGGTQFISDGKAAFTDEAGMQTLEFWQQIYADGYSSAEAYSGDMWAGPFADGIAAMGVAGPWGKAQFDGKVNFGVTTIPTEDGKAADATYTFADSKNIGMYTSCENLQTAWDFLKYSVNDENDLSLLEITGQFPNRSNVTELAASFLDENPFYTPFAEAVPLAVDVPEVEGLAEKMQIFRDAWSSVIQSGSGDISTTFNEAAEKIDALG